MAYLAPIHRPSSIRHALKLNFLSAAEECLVVAKANCLEFYSQSPDGLVLQHSKAIYGKVTMLQKLRQATSITDHLFVGTDRQMYFTLSWDPTTKQLQTERKYVSVADNAAREAQTGNRCHIDPTGRFIIIEVYEGIINVVPLVQRGKKKKDAEIANMGEPLPTRIEELFVRSSAFLHPRSPRDDKPKLALLYEDSMSRVKVKLRELEFANAPGTGDMVKLDEIQELQGELELGASHIIPISGPTFGLLILGETSISYYDETLNEIHTKPLDDATIFVAWERIDNQRFVLADDYGKLYLLMLVVDENKNVADWKMDVIGKTTRASVLVYLDGGQIFVGAHQGDSQVIRISEKSLEVIQTFANIAPILDFTVMDMGNRSGEGQANEYSSGQARIVTGSGAYQDGSLRSVRSGVGLEDLGLLGEMKNILNIFSLKSSSTAESVDTLLVTFVDESRAFSFDSNGEVEEVDNFRSLALSENTLLACNLPQDRILQVTGSHVQVSDLEGGMIIAEWSPPNGHPITAASANDKSVLLSSGGVLLFVLDVTNGIRPAAGETVSVKFGADTQVSCIALPTITQKPIAFLGFWQQARVSIVDLVTLEPIHTVTVAENSVPRSMILTTIFQDQPPILFIAMADGNVVTYSMNPNTYELSGKKTIVLGTQEANFRALPRGDGTFNIFATCEQPSLIYGSENRLVYSAVTAEKAISVCSFDSEAYPGAIAIATSEDLRIAVVDAERTTHVQTLHVNETVRRIAYSPALKAFGLGTIKRILKNGVEIMQSHFKLADEVLFKELDTYPLNEDELVESIMRCELDDGSGGLVERFVIGTAYLDDEQDTSQRGRIIVLEVTADIKLKEVGELSLRGGCRCLAMIQGKIVAALIKTVVIYAFEYTTPSKPFFNKVASYRTATAPIDITVTGNAIVIADLMKSVSVVEYKRGEAGLPDTLTEIARHFQTTWGTAVAEVDENTYLESDAEGNLMVLKRDTNAVTLDDKRRLQVTSEMLLGELVNRIRRINVATSPNAFVIPRAFVATVEGSIYLFALINNQYQNLLISLQSNLAELIQSPGDVEFNSYRAFKNHVRESSEPERFVDGELIERFLDCSPEVQEKVVEGLGDVEEVRAMVESLRRLH
ncbi:DNA damage-binding protein 1 [Mytilinidion resinicola]|uniref:DNA damage-binding protein 1 n=1 Tax=Mytilinidion resinicola TaxID=574789 RepID=A0A6A6Z5R6_9PEZI|nr:DNA damage-binding protein 1 [Mytilinidion resinicola]KAF2816370.1 DNA damage-binding protein 1 [Mytilinidion resinicola]